MGRQNRTNDERNHLNDRRYDNNRKERHDRRTDYGNRNNQQQINRRNEDSDHDERVLAAIDKRNRNYADAVRNQMSTGPNQNNDVNVPIHEKISINRRQSRRNMNHQRMDRPREDEPNYNRTSRPREGAHCPREDYPLMGHPREGDRLERQQDSRNNGEKDREIEILRKKIEKLERSRTGAERVLSHYSKDMDEPPKNVMGAQQQGPSDNNLNLVEMQNFIKGAMATINNFAKQLNKVTGTTQTPSDRS